jgi:uncharacterized protein with GYD domain
MVRYLTLIQFTDKGVKDIKDSPHRAEMFRGRVEKAGGRVCGLYWALGEFDGAVVFEAPDDVTATGLLLTLSRDGFVRTKSARLFEAAEFEQVLAKI